MTNETVLIFVGIGLLGLYFLPAIIAKRRGHHNSVAIFLTNLFFGWTFIGWVAALIWAATAIRKES